MAYFVKMFGKKSVVVDMPTVTAYVASRPWPPRRKRSILESLKNYARPDGTIPVMTVLRKSKVKAFVKDEPYPLSEADNKHPRAICSRSDEAKAIYGVIFEGFNEALFHSKFSVKHRPAQEKAVEIEGRLHPREGAFI